MNTSDPRVAFFDQHAATWDAEGPPIDATLSRLGALAADCGLGAGIDVAEIGCGTGQVTPWLAERVAPGRVFSVDFSAEMLARAKQRGAAGDYACLDVCATPLPAASFDLIFCMHVFPHFVDIPAALRNFSAALRPGGAVVVLHLAHWRDINEFHDQIGGAVAGDHLPRPEEWAPLAADADLALDRLVDDVDLLLVRLVKNA